LVLSTTARSYAPGVGPLLGRLELLQSLDLPLLRLVRARGAHVGDLESLEVDLLLVELLLDLLVGVVVDEVGDDVQHLEGQVGQVLEHHGALEGGV